jgi:ATP phosphoribosyltransferase
MNLSIALPKGRLLTPTAELLARAGLMLDDYSEKGRLYRLKSQSYPELRVKMFQEKDIPIQIAIGNYDIGICGLDWIEEQIVKYPSSALVKFKYLGYGEGAVYAAVSSNALKEGSLEVHSKSVRIVSEYPNLADALAQKLRLRRFSIFPLWGAAEGYPPENAEIVLLSRKLESGLFEHGLISLGKVVDSMACLIVNRESLKTKDMSRLLNAIMKQIPFTPIIPDHNNYKDFTPLDSNYISEENNDNDIVKLALPDGHQQAHVRKILDAAGIKIEDYPSKSGNRRPLASFDGFFVKIIRPQDMPLQIANGNFDIAITGRDWLTDHLYQFPGSPLRELLDLKYGWVRIVAVVSNEVPVNNPEELRAYCRTQGKSYRVASEYINIADNYARGNHLGRYRIIPTWGATEAFLPEDADLLIENTETGSTIARHNLRIIDTLFESTACVVGRKETAISIIKQQRVDAFVSALAKGVKALV